MLNLLFIAIAAFAGKSDQCSDALAPFVVRVEFATDVSDRVDSWRAAADRLGLKPSNVGTDSSGRVGVVDVVGEVDQVHRFAHGLGGLLTSVLAADERISAWRLAKPRAELGWGPAFDLPITHYDFTSEELFGLGRRLNIHLIGELTRMSFGELSAAKVFSAAQLLHIDQVVTGQGLHLRGGGSVVGRADHLLDAPLEEVGFDRSTLLKIDANDKILSSLRDIVVRRESDLRGLCKMGDLAVASIRAVAAGHGFDLGLDPRTLPRPLPVDTSKLGEFVDVLGLDRFERARLRRAGVMTLRDLVQITPHEVGQLGFRVNQIENMRLALAKRKLAFRTRLYGLDGSDPEFLAHVKETATKCADGSVDLEPYRDQPVWTLPIARATAHWLHYRGHVTVKKVLKQPIDRLEMHPARISNLEAVLAIFCPPFPLANGRVAD